MQNFAPEPAVFGIHYKEDDYYKGSFPRFYDTGSFEEVKAVEEKWEIIRDEIFAYLNAGHDLKTFSSPTSPGASAPDAWKKMYFMNCLWMHFDNCRKLPKTWNILRQIPGVTLGAVLILAPGGYLEAHSSESNINIRCHLGIRIPAPYPVLGIKVGPEERGWEDGKVIMFSDCHRHTVWNNSNENRVIVAFDILHQQYRNRGVWLCSKYLAALSIRALDATMHVRNKIPATFLRLFHNAVAIGWYLYVNVQAKTQFLFTSRV
jgi:aspartyl/asparaginyl beta-hydroxylase (cupin superfamily)